MRRASLSEFRTAIASARAYLQYSHASVDQTVDVICDYMRLPDDRDSRVVRNALIRDQARPPAGRAAR